MNKDNIKCKCGKNFNSFQFKKRFKNCSSFKEKFDKFDFKMNMSLKEYITKADVCFVKIIIKLYIHIIDKIKKKNNIIEFLKQSKKLERNILLKML